MIKRKKPLKRSSRPSRSTTPTRKTRVKRRNAKRSAKNDLRATGGITRRKFVQSLPCAACGIEGYSVNAHLLGNGGMSRKQAATTIGPLCGDHYTLTGCHTLYDEHRWDFDAIYPDFNPEQVAAGTEAAWRARVSQERTPNG